MSEGKKYYVDKNLILGSIARQNKSVLQFCKEIGLKSSNFYVALDNGWRAPRSRVISKIANALGLSDSVIWTNE